MDLRTIGLPFFSLYYSYFKKGGLLSALSPLHQPPASCQVSRRRRGLLVGEQEESQRNMREENDNKVVAVVALG